MESPEWVYIVIFFILTYVQVLLSLKIPEYMTDISDLMQQGGVAIAAFIPFAVRMLICSLLCLILAIASGYLISYVSSLIILRMRKDLFQKIMSFNLAEIRNYSTSSLITRCTNDIEQIRQFLNIGFRVLVQGPLTVVLAIIKMRGNMQWMNVLIYTAVFMTVISVLFFLLSVKISARAQKLLDDISRISKEHLSGIRVVHGFNGYDYQSKSFDATSKELANVSISANRYIGAILPFYNLSLNGLTFIIYVYGSYMIYQEPVFAQKQAMFSQMIVFSSYALQALGAFAFIVAIIAMLPRVVISLRRVTEVIDSEIEIRDGHASSGAGDNFGTVEFRNVSFAYPGVGGNVLSDISFKVEKGQTAAIIGGTGSGKTTLLNLILRLYDVTEGAIFVDGRDVRGYKLWNLRDKIGYVPQKSFLFSGTIAMNIGYGIKSGLGDAISSIKKAAEIGQSRDFIEKKHKQYDAVVEEGGSNFSGGQRQRLTVSRAVCRDPEFYLFDDSFSALDFKTDSILRRNLRENAKDSTQIIVGQRIGSIMNADLIIVLDKGKIVGQGKHEELIKNCSVYREIALSQLADGEV